MSEVEAETAAPGFGATPEVSGYDRTRFVELALKAGGIGTLDVDLRSLVSRRGGAAAELFGLTFHEALGHDEWLAFLSPEDRAATVQAFDAMLQTGCRYDVEYRIRRKLDGDVRWISVRAEPLLDTSGRPARLVGVVQDVTATKATETALRGSEARLLLAQRAAGLGSFDWLTDEPMAAVSEEYGAIFGLPPGTSHHSYAHWASQIHREDRDRVVTQIHAMLEGGRYDIEYSITRADDGRTRRLASRAELFADRGSKRQRVIGALRDVTTVRRTEAELRLLNEKLECRVREEVAAREAAQTRLAQAQRMEALGQLAGGIAHDFNNVLQAVHGAATLIELRAENPASVRRLARMSVEAAARGASVTGRLLAFARRDDLHATAIETRPLLEGIGEMLRHALGAAIEVRVQAPPDLPPVFADKGQLETVLINLATNGRDAMESGGVLTLEARTEAGPGGTEASGLTPGAYVEIAVTDTGCGMDEATQARATELFFTTKPPLKGTGLGLSMARAFAEQSGGALRIESRPDHGTEVRLWLPVAASTQAAAVEPARTGAPAGRSAAIRRHIAVVDDDQTIRETIALQLGADGHEVSSLPTWPAALDHLGSGAKVDLIVGDLALPGAKGVRMLEAIHAHAPGLALILLTGVTGDEVGIGSPGLVQVLRKPVPLSVLSARVSALLED